MYMGLDALFEYVRVQSGESRAMYFQTTGLFADDLSRPGK
jgi:hypothetical protein